MFILLCVYISLVINLINVIICVAKDNSAIVAIVLPKNGEENKLLLRHNCCTGFFNQIALNEHAME